MADIVDNSISAGAKNIDIFFRYDPAGGSCVSIKDDGCGMDESELFEAMRPGSTNPKDYRAPDDLGRFGLGLKTASFSQCRKLTVVSRKNGRTAAACWDLDFVSRTGEWKLVIPEPEKVPD